jgi:hypothetical protein
LRIASLAVNPWTLERLDWSREAHKNGEKKMLPNKLLHVVPTPGLDQARNTSQT